MTGHPDAGVLAEFREGLLGRRRSARVSAHLRGCARCTALDAGLAEVTALLASAPLPEMPAELAARLDAALAAEAAPGNGTRGTARGLLRSAGGPGRASPAAWRGALPRAATAAAAVLVLAGGGVGLAMLARHPAGTTGTAASSAQGSAHGAIGRPVPTAGQGQGAAKDGFGGVLAPARSSPGVAGAAVVRSGTDYLPGRLRAQVAAVLDRYLSRAAALPANGTAAKAPLMYAPSMAVDACVRLISGGARTRLVDLAQYQHRPATVIVLSPAGGRPAQVWVVGAGCSAAHRDVLAHAQLPAAG